MHAGWVSHNLSWAPKIGTCNCYNVWRSTKPKTTKEGPTLPNRSKHEHMIFQAGRYSCLAFCPPDFYASMGQRNA